MVQLVQRNWQQNQGVDGTVMVKFTITRDGMINDVQVEEQSTPFLNLSAQRAVTQTRQLPPLPAAFTNDRLTVHLVFQFKR
jgi:TonB family protein